MLSPANQSLVARDPDLPGLRLVLDPDRREAWVKSLWPDVEISGFQCEYLRYKRGVSCVMGARLTTDRGQTWVTLTARSRETAHKFGKLRPSTDDRWAATGAEYRLHSSLPIVINRFPADRQIRHLWYFADRKKRKRLFEKIGLPRRASLGPLRYNPGRRFVGRVDFDGIPLAVVKMHADAKFAKARRAVAHVGARSIGISPRHKLIASEWVEGRTANCDEADAYSLGFALARLHGQESRDLPVLKAKRQRNDAFRMVGDISALVPELAEQVADIAAQIARGIENTGRCVTLHGDCHIEQAVIRNGEAAFFDFDQASFGPPEWDLGNLIAHLMVEQGSGRLASGFRSSLIEGYRAGGGIVNVDSLQAQTALGILKLSMRPFRQQWSDWPAAITSIVDMAHDLCPNKHMRPTTATQFGERGLPHLARALDRKAAQEAFVRAGLEFEVERCRLIRHKNRRRCLIEYRVRDAEGRRTTLLGKMRAKGTDRRTYRLHRDLRLLGLMPTEASAAVPRPVGVVSELGLWLQEKVPGRSFSTRDCSPERLAEAVGLLHRADLSIDRYHSLSDELALLEERCAELSRRKPVWSKRIAKLMREIGKFSEAGDVPSPRPIHRDFYHDNLLVDRTVWLLDLDLVAMGDPALDIGNFVAHLTELSIRKYGHPFHYADWQAHFIAAACRSATGVSAESIRLYELLALLRLVEIDDRMAERRRSAPVLFDHCERVIQQQNSHVGRLT